MKTLLAAMATVCLFRNHSSAAEPPAGVIQFEPFVWRSAPPPDCPLPNSSMIAGLRFLGRCTDYRLADDWRSLTAQHPPRPTNHEPPSPEPSP
jgi:hypothetical protein